MKWLLIFLFMDIQGRHVVSLEFNTEQACKTVRDWVAPAALAQCFPKGKESS